MSGTRPETTKEQQAHHLLGDIKNANLQFSPFSEDPIFEVMVRGHAAANNFWASVWVPAQRSAAMPAGGIGSHGYRIGRCPADGNPGWSASTSTVPTRTSTSP
jgi:hypothetical protein